jgi:hypothetical protein
MVTGKPIFNSFLAKQLVLKGHRIIDLQKNHKIANATVFFFEVAMLTIILMYFS